MPSRLRPPSDPVILSHDGAEVTAERGEPLVVSLLAAGGFVLTRSPKLHRPRGPYCLRGGCEGCLVRVDGRPNMMACQTLVRGGEVVETQNVMGSRELDVLGATDYLFPRGIDHHRLFAGVRGVSTLVQAFARRVSGLGRLPDTEVAARPARRLEIDVLVVGGGSAGLAAASVLGSRAVLADDQLELGGSLAALDPELAGVLRERAVASGAALMPATAVVGLYAEPEDGSGRRTALLVGPEGALHVRCRAIVLATGTHDPTPPFENNDLPGIMSARAALGLWRRGVLVGERIAVVGDGRFARRLLALVGERARAISLDPDMVVRALGRPELSGIKVSAAGVERRIRADAVVVDGPGAPAFELAVQAGGAVRFEPARGYVPVLDGEGSVAPGVFAAGSLVGSSDSAADGARAAERAAASLA